MISCKKFVTVDAPVTQLVTVSVFNNDGTATAAQTVIYSSMFNDQSTFRIEYYTGVSGDELTDYGGYPNLYDNSLNAIDDGPIVGGNWTQSYNYIFKANLVIEGLQNSKGISPSVKQQLLGEAKFVRAFWYFYLVNLYGDVPLILSSDYKVNGTASRKPKEQIYQQMIIDLKDANMLLSSNYVDVNDTSVSTERVRPNKSAATALLARVYLYIGDWKNAEETSDSVINNSTLYKLDSNLNNVFLANSTETIWQLMAPPTSYYTQDGGFFILHTAPTSSTYTISLSEQLLDAFEGGDKRKSNWIDSISILGKTYYYPFKYKAGTSSTTVTEYEMVIRLAEVYLIRAEARAQQGNITDLNNGALSDLNAIRNRAGLFNYAGATDKTSILTAILHERQVELFTEWGHRWFDLKRTNSIDSVMTVVTPQKSGLSWSSIQQFYPIPLTDIQTDPNLKQTSGY